MAIADPHLVPVTLPDGRVVRMVSTPGLAAAGLTRADDPFAGQSFDTVGGGGAGAPMTPGQAAVAGAMGGGGAAPTPLDQMTPAQRIIATATMGATDANAHKAPTPKSNDPFAGKSFDEIGAPQTPAGSENVQDVADPTGAAGGTHWVKGGPVEKNKIVKEGAQISDETVGAIGAGYGEQIKGAEAQRSAVETAQTNAAIAADNAILDEKDALDQRKARRVAIDQELGVKNDKREAANKGAEEAAVDPLKWYKNRPTWAKALSGLGLMISAASQRMVEGLQGQSAQPLRGVEILHESWQDSIRDQQIRYEHAKDKADVANNQYREAIELYGTPEAAKLALEEQHSKLAQRYLENKKQRVTDAQTLGAIDAVIGQLKTTQAEKSAELEALMSDEVTRNIENRPGYLAGANGAPVGGKAAGPKAGSPAAQTNAEADNAIASAEATAAYAQSLIDKGETTVPGYSVVGSIAKKIGTGIAGNAGMSSEQSLAQQHVNNLAIAKRKPGESSDADFERNVQRVVGDGSPAALLRAARETIEENRRRKAATGAEVAPEVPGAKR